MNLIPLIPLLLCNSVTAKYVSQSSTCFFKSEMILAVLGLF